MWERRRKERKSRRRNGSEKLWAGSCGKVASARVCVITSVAAAAATLFNRRAAKMNGKRSSRKLPIRRNERVPTGCLCVYVYIYMYIILNARADLSSAAADRSVSLIVVRARAPLTRHHNIYITTACYQRYIIYMCVCVYREFGATTGPHGEKPTATSPFSLRHDPSRRPQPKRFHDMIYPPPPRTTAIFNRSPQRIVGIYLYNIIYRYNMIQTGPCVRSILRDLISFSASRPQGGGGARGHSPPLITIFNL